MVICHSYVKLLPFPDVKVMFPYVPIIYHYLMESPLGNTKNNVNFNGVSIPEPRCRAFQGLSVQVWHPMWAVGIVQRLEFC